MAAKCSSLDADTIDASASLISWMVTSSAVGGSAGSGVVVSGIGSGADSLSGCDGICGSAGYAEVFYGVW